MTRPADDWEPSGADVADGPDLVKEHASTLLSTLSMLAVVIGLGWGLWPYLGPWSLCIAGVLLGLIVSITDQMRKPPADPPPADAPQKPKLPGPSDPGTLHVGGAGA